MMWTLLFQPNTKPVIAFTEFLLRTFHEESHCHAIMAAVTELNDPSNIDVYARNCIISLSGRNTGGRGGGHHYSSAWLNMETLK